MTEHKGKIGVLTEAHFDETEYRRFNEYFPKRGYEVEYLSHLWGHPSLTFTGNDNDLTCTVTTEVETADPSDYKAIILIGAYAMDRLRYEEHPQPKEPNRAPAVEFLRKAVERMDAGELKVGTICHSLWLFCADPDLLHGRKVTCAHNIMSDVVNAGGEYVYAPEGGGVNVCIDGGLVSARHPEVVDEFMDTFVREIESS
jgi:putative intracellular protease/amidase